MPLSSPAPHPDFAEIQALVSDLAASVLCEANCSLLHSFKAFVNYLGSVTHVVTDTAIPAASFALYFAALTPKLNQSYSVGQNPWLPFCLASTTLQLAIYLLPVDIMPHRDKHMIPTSLTLSSIRRMSQSPRPAFAT